MVAGAKPATKAESDRMVAIKDHVPCVPCLISISRVRLPSVQHIVRGMRRQGHDQTYPSCDWHHFGHIGQQWTRQRMLGMFGPSIAHGRKSFESHYGPEEILVEITDYLLSAYEQQPWMYYNVPDKVRLDAEHLWLKRLKQGGYLDIRHG